MGNLTDDEARYGAILDLAVDGIIVIDSRGHISTFNKAAERIFGWDATEVMGKNITLLMPEPYHSEHDRYIERYENTAEAKIIGIGREVVGRRKDGSTFPMDLAVSEVPSRSGKRLYTGIVRDLTERRRFETLAEVGRLASGLAHEIGTPMNVILGYAERLRLRTQEERTSEGLSVVIEQVERVTRLMDQLLSYARRAPMQRGPFPLSSVTRSVSAILGASCKEKGITFDLFIDPPGALVVGDKDRMEQVLLNLCVNAVDAMPNGGELTVSARPCQDPTDAPMLEITVADTGLGIPADRLGSIFEPFVTWKASGRGTGLGLAVVRGIVREHEGSIAVESVEGQGTTFRLRLPSILPGA